MQSSSPLHFPSSPSPNARCFTVSHQPLNSSPLAAAQSRRQSQYKSRVRPSRSVSLGSSSPPRSAEDAQKSFLRERLKARCLERAMNARVKAVRDKRRKSESDASSSDGFEMEYDDEDDDDEAVMQDELFRRIIENADRKRQHLYRLSYQEEVGSSVDPDMEDIGHWENELHQIDTDTTLTTNQNQNQPEIETPEDLEAEELLAYAEECAILAEFEDLDVLADQIFSLSDTEEHELAAEDARATAHLEPVDDGMDIS